MKQEIDIRAYNRAAWNRNVEQGNRWTVPVSPEVIAAARDGVWELFLTPTITVPGAWFPKLDEADVLCLASGGGQQGPVLAAVGAAVTVFDNSPQQLAQDRLVAEREGLQIRLEEGDMADLSIFPDECFNLIVHPVSNVFVPHLVPVWQETFRVLRPGGILLSGITNPYIYLFDYELLDEKGVLDVRYSLPYSDVDDLPLPQLQERIGRGEPLEYSHTLEEQLGGQLQAGFILTGFYEDNFEEDYILNDYFPGFMAVRAVKPPL